MKEIFCRMNVYLQTHPLVLGDSDCETVLDQLYQTYAESHESDHQEIAGGFKDLEEFLCTLSLETNSAVFTLCFRLCSTYEREACVDGVQYGAAAMLEIVK